MRVAIAVLLALILFGAGAPAQAQSTDVPALISLIQKQPAGVDRLTWKEQRRDAAKKLGASGDKRAVPVLIELVENETFDIIGEIAIEGLGKLGDKSAIEVLEKVSKDQSRDVSQRDAAKKALAKLNAGTTDDGGGDKGGGDKGGGDKGGDDKGGDDGGIDVGGGGTIIGSGGDETPAEGPTWTDDVLAASEQLTLIAGASSFGWDSVRRRLGIDLDAGAHYARTMDKDKVAWKFGGDARMIFGVDNPEGRAKNILVLATARGFGEFRGYGGPGLYGVGYAALNLEMSRLTSNDANDPAADLSNKWVGLDLQLAIGGGYGRVLDVGTRARVARIATALERQRALGRPIDDNLARKLQSAWWALRGELGAHRRLTTTVRILRDAGVLLGEPDAGTTYELLEILEDPSLDGRASGFEADLAFGEGYLYRSRTPQPDPNFDYDEGRLEELLVRARFAQQIGDESDLSAGLFGRLRLFAADMEPAPWAISATGRWRKFVYGNHFDPTGVFDIGAEVGLSDDDLDTTNAGLRVGGEIGWTMILSRASAIRVSGDLTLDAGEVFLGGRLEASYGFLDNAFSSALK